MDVPPPPPPPLPNGEELDEWLQLVFPTKPTLTRESDNLLVPLDLILPSLHNLRGSARSQPQSSAIAARHPRSPPAFLADIANGAKGLSLRSSRQSLRPTSSDNASDSDASAPGDSQQVLERKRQRREAKGIARAAAQSSLRRKGPSLDRDGNLLKPVKSEVPNEGVTAVEQARKQLRRSRSMCGNGSLAPLREQSLTASPLLLRTQSLRSVPSKPEYSGRGNSASSADFVNARQRLRPTGLSTPSSALRLGADAQSAGAAAPQGDHHTAEANLETLPEVADLPRTASTRASGVRPTRAVTRTSRSASNYMAAACPTSSGTKSGPVVVQSQTLRPLSERDPNVPISAESHKRVTPFSSRPLQRPKLPESFLQQ